MKKISVISFTSLLLFSLQSSCMYDNSIQIALSTPDLIKLLAYAIIDTAEIKPNSHKKVLTSLLNFSLSNKNIHTIIYNLRCGSNKESEQFNNHLVTHLAKSFEGKINPECLAAAYIGTPLALAIVKKHYNATTMEEFSKGLDAKLKSYIYDRYNPSIYDGPPSASLSYKIQYSQESQLEIKQEPISETVSKFPLSTYHFCFGELFRKKD